MEAPATNTAEELPAALATPVDSRGYAAQLPRTAVKAPARHASKVDPRSGGTENLRVRIAANSSPENQARSIPLRATRFRLEPAPTYKFLDAVYEGGRPGSARSQTYPDAEPSKAFTNRRCWALAVRVAMLR